MEKPMSFYADQVKQANTKEELNAISYKAFRDDDGCTVDNKKMNVIINLCILREVELGLLPNDSKWVAKLRKTVKSYKD